MKMKTIVIKEETHRELKIMAARLGLTFDELIRKLLKGKK